MVINLFLCNHLDILFVAYLQHQSVHPALFYDTTIGLLKQKAMSCYLIQLKLSITDDALFDGLMLFLNVTVEHNKTSLTILNGLSTKGYSFPGGFEMLINCFRFFFSFVPFFACRNKSNFQIFGFVRVLGEVVPTKQSTVLILIIFFYTATDCNFVVCLVYMLWCWFLSACCVLHINNKLLKLNKTFQYRLRFGLSKETSIILRSS